MQDTGIKKMSPKLGAANRFDITTNPLLDVEVLIFDHGTVAAGGQPLVNIRAK